MADSNPMKRKCDEMNKRIAENENSTGGQSQGEKRPFIFKIDQILDKDRFTPQLICIGPYCRDYRDNSRFQKMEAFKSRCLQYSLKESQKNLETYMQKRQPLVQEARDCYSESYVHQLDDFDFLEMMVLDGCFIVHFIRFSYPYRRKEKPEQSVTRSHPLARMERANLPKICADLLIIQNQIPYQVLERIFEVSKVEGEPQSLSTLIVEEFFSAILGFRYRHNRNLPEVQWMHLLDLVRSILIPSDYEGWPPIEKETPGEIQIPLEFQFKPLDTIPCVSTLRRVGIKVRPHRPDGLVVNFNRCRRVWIRVRPHRPDGLVVNFNRGVIWMPKITLNDLMCSFLENCVKLEQGHNDRSKHCSVYALCLDCLVNTASDVDYLCERGVIENYLKTDEEAANFFNHLGKGLTFDWDYGDFYALCYRVNGYRQKEFRRYWTSFKGEYFDKPWLLISVVVGFVLLVLSFLQTYYTMYPYVPHKK